MRPLELVSIFSELATIIWLGAAAPGNRSWRLFWSGAGMLPALLQVVIEGYRWQMLPAYFAGCLALIIFAWIDTRHYAIGLALCVSLLVLSGLAAVIYPVFQLPRPNGPYSIGNLTYHLVDSSRKEVFGPRAGPRELMIEVWYPAEAEGRGTAQPYRDAATTSREFAYLKFVKTHTWRRAPIANSPGEFPVVLFTPSWHGLRNQEMAVVEELVSHGFVVVGVDHPYGSGVVAFPDGRKVWARPVSFMDTSSEASTRESLGVAEEEVRVRALDLVFALNELEKINRRARPGVLTHRLNLARVGILGYSFGGAVAVEACWLDARFRCAVDLDGALFGRAASEGIAQPLLVMTDSASAPPPEELTSRNAVRRRYAAFLKEQVRLLRQDMKIHGGYIMEIDGIAHANFSDAGLVSPLRWLTGGGRIGRYRAATIVRAYTLAFFDEYLNGTPHPLLSGASEKFPEVRLEVSLAKYGLNDWTKRSDRPAQKP